MHPTPLRWPGTLLVLAFALTFGEAKLLVAADAPRRNFDVPAGEASRTLKLFSEQSSRGLIVGAAEIEGIKTNPVVGEFTLPEALDRLLAGTGLVAREDAATGAFAISRAGTKDSPIPSTGAAQGEISADPGPGIRPAATVTGRIQSASSGQYLNNARVSVKGTGLITFSDESGTYRLERVPASAAVLEIFHTGMQPQRVAIDPAPGAVLNRDIRLESGDRDRTDDEIVKLQAFAVAASREIEARAIAINEQRFASNIKNVVSTDEFGDLGNSSVGDFIKFLPGVIVDAEQVSVRGFPAHTVPLTVDGNRVATQFSEENNLRSSSLDSVALNNVARVEVSKSPTPDSPADSLGGAVNLVSKRAFERATPLFRYHAYVTGTTEHLTLGRVPGPNARTSGRRIGPGVDFSYVAPLSDNFGFTLTGVAFSQLETSHQFRKDWVPHGLGRAGATATNPYLARFELNNRETYRSRASFGSTVDWKITPRNVLTLGAQYTFTTMDQVGNSNIGDVAGQNNNLVPIGYGPTFTQGAPNAGTQQYAGASRYVPITTVLLSAKLTHEGPVWQFEGSGSFSKSTGRFRDIDYGFFQNSTFRMERATIRYDDIRREYPGQIVVQNSAGVTVPAYTLGEYRILTATSAQKNELDYVYGGRAHARRRFDGTVPIIAKIGGEWREQIRDMRSPAPRWNFVGPDRVAGTPDDLAGRYDVLETEYFEGAGAAGIKTAQWPDRYKLYQLFLAHPEYFEFNEVGTLQASTANSRKIIETISAAYVRLDTRLWRDRLLLVGGVRFERTEDYGEGQLNDLRATYRQDAAGRLVLDAAGRPIRVSPDANVRARLQYKERGTRAERSYDDFFPSLNATLNLRENLIARAAYAKTFGRPNFQSIVPTLSVTDPASANRIITATDPGLKPWTGNNYDLSLEYYFTRGGLVSAGVFRKDIRNFFGQTRVAATSDRLEDFGLTDEFLDYDIVTAVNVGDARVDGTEVNYRQELTFLPRWARGLQIHANATHLELEGANSADFNSFVPRSYNWGLSLNRPRFNVSLNWHQRGRQQGGRFTENNAPADTFQYTAPSRRLDLNFGIRISRRVSVYGVVRNVTGSDANQRAGEIFSPLTPEYARLRIQREAPTALNFGVKGEY